MSRKRSDRLLWYRGDERSSADAAPHGHQLDHCSSWQPRNTLPSSPDNAGVVTVARHFSRAEEVNMIEVPIPEPPSPREEVIQILAEGLWELVVRGKRPDQSRPKSAQPGENTRNNPSTARSESHPS